DQPFVLAGVHPCDLAAIELLDMAYAQHPPEVRWPAERERGIIIGMDCHPDEYCFCTSVGTSENRRPCDLFLTPVEQGYLVEVHTPEGNRLLKNVSTSPFSDRDLREAREWRAGKAAKISAVLDASMAEIASILEKGGFGDIFEETAERCYSCGSCNTTCPTCFCFIMEEHLDADLQTGLRKRTWDSCQLPEFAKVVDGHNFRGERWQRVKHRWHRKFLYLYRQFERPYCTGCGRCGRACTTDINIVDITNRLISHSRKEDPDA
ncbi:MAG: 4Fe-4S dicluster domain-containing protein, partial [Deltaproteobacteria bacterium]|nr:4Fe-4S dicluster domain-containing protein [Deltaproteobacteria bacterium]